MRAWALVFLTGCIVVNEDADGDGAVGIGDCDPHDATRYVGAPELCNGVDDDCDGEVDEEPGAANGVAWYFDRDRDGFGDPNTVVHACSAGTDWVDNADDCDDTTAEVGAERQFWPDADIDGWGDAGAEPVVQCNAPEGAYAPRDGDCDDADPSVRPNADEDCNGVDDDCDGTIDEGALSTFFRDADADGFGDAAAPVAACAPPDGTVEDARDCDDTDAAVFPDAPRFCNDGIDNACDAAAGVDPATRPCVDRLDTAARILGSVGSAQLGYAVAPARDLFGAGEDGLLVSAIGWSDPASGDQRGAAWLIPVSGLDLGAGAPFDGRVDEVGVALTGAQTFDQAGSGIAAPGDMDGDGCPEIAVGAHLFDEGLNNVGAVFLVDGCAVAEMPGGSLDLGEHPVLTGDFTADWIGGQLAPAGDVDGDGLPDLLAGGAGMANGTDGNAGGVVLLFGDASLAPVSAADVVPDGRGALFLGPEGEGAGVGLALASADLDGDGLSDVVAGAWKMRSERGAVFLVSGSDAAGERSLGDAATATLEGASANGAFGASVARLLDSDGDGRDELAVSAPTDSELGAYLGGAVLVFSAPAAGLAGMDGWTPVDADATLLSATAWARLGLKLAADGDVDGDGRGDIAASGAPDSTGSYKVVDVFLGPFAGTIEDTDARAQIIGEEMFANHGGSLGFVRGTTHDAVVVGAPQHDNDAGEILEDAGAVMIVDGFGL